MIANSPLKMMYRAAEWTESKVVYVYDFMHEPFETLQSFALCWCPQNNAWITVNVAMLTPITDQTKILNEGKM